MNKFDNRNRTHSGQNFGPQQTSTGLGTQGNSSGGGSRPAVPEKRENVIGGINRVVHLIAVPINEIVTNGLECVSIVT